MLTYTYTHVSSCVVYVANMITPSSNIPIHHPPPTHPPTRAAPEAEAKANLLSLMREWLQEKVAMADRVLVEHAVTKVYDGDTILTYAYSQVTQGRGGGGTALTVWTGMCFGTEGCAV